MLFLRNNMKIVLMISAIFFCSLSSVAQQKQFITVDQLSDRISRGGDTAFVINFWATWCAPCLKEMPHFEKLQSTYRKQKVKVLLVSVDFKSKYHTAVLPYVKKHKIASEVFLLNESDQQQYIDRIDQSWSGAIPATLFVKAGQRKFVEKELTYPQLVQQLQTFK